MPNAEQWKRIRILFDECHRLEPAAIERRLEAEPDHVVRDRVRALLDAEPGTDFLEPPPEPLLQAELGDFELGVELGRGGMGIVRAAVQKSTGREVAIKFVQVSPKTNPVLAFALRREAARSFSLRHPHIVRVYSVGEEESGPFIVMQRVQGESLARRIEAARERRDRGDADHWKEIASDGHSGFEAVALFVSRLADALSYSHEQRLIHRDVKPGNILVQPDGTGLLTDFGIAKDLDSETVTGVPVGTPHYMSPEQAKARSLRIDHRTDVYSLGVVAYEMLTLRRPFDGPTDLDVLQAVQTAQPRRIRACNPDVPRALEAIIDRAMQRSVELRYDTAADLSDDLQRFLRGEQPRARPPSQVQRLLRTIHRHRNTVRWAAASALLVAVATGLSFMLWSPTTAGALNFDPRVPDSEVLAIQLDPYTMRPTGREMDLGRRPEHEELPAGWWTIRFTDGDQGVDWIGEVPLDGEVEVLVTRLDVHPLVDVEMISVPSGVLQRIGWSDVPVEAFLLDRTEVSNEQYRLYLEETGQLATKPATWPGDVDAWPDGFGDLPVSNVSCDEAQAYATWAGKRLPTRFEWHFAARGSNGYRYVWGHEYDETRASGCVVGGVAPDRMPHRHDPARPDWERRTYLALCRPVGTSLSDVSWCGVHDLQGSVREWSLSPHCDATEDPPAVRSEMRTVHGGYFGQPPEYLSQHVSVEHFARDSSTGFRCARSLIQGEE